MRRLNRSKDFVSTLPTAINQKLVDGYRVKLFAKIKDSLDKKKQCLQKEEVELKVWIDKKSFINQPINNFYFTPYIGA
ncbi:hypothetical protein [Aliarcobacter butzleri]|uniref:hypothetical protein n=1 Tax=Aliarcobacter butzleri TaxID=28197 RepID=UPI002B244E1B|nr:hypothetical protein [Aliarcobacter butzleri]